MSDGVESGVSARRGWGWVFGGGLVGTVLAMVPSGDGWLWGSLGSAFLFVWGLPYVAPVVCVGGVVAGLVVGLRMWRRRGW